MMKIGVMVLFTEATAAPAVIAPRCEEMGFESLFIPEHQLVPPITKSYNHPNWQTIDTTIRNVANPNIGPPGTLRNPYGRVTAFGAERQMQVSLKVQF